MLLLCCMSREKVSISLDKDEKSLRTFNLQHMVKAMSPTSWHLTNFFHRKECESKITVDSQKDT